MSYLLSVDSRVIAWQIVLKMSLSKGFSFSSALLLGKNNEVAKKYICSYQSYSWKQKVLWSYDLDNRNGFIFYVVLFRFMQQQICKRLRKIVVRSFKTVIGKNWIIHCFCKLFSGEKAIIMTIFSSWRKTQRINKNHWNTLSFKASTLECNFLTF